MKKAAIVIDDWKLPIFKEALDAEGYEYEEIKGPTHKCITLRVETDSIAKLVPIVKRMNQEAAISRAH